MQLPGQHTPLNCQSIYTFEHQFVNLNLDTIPGDTQQEQTLNIALLLLYGYHLIGAGAISTHLIRKTCQQYGCLDAPHFMRVLKHATQIMTISGTRRAYRASLTKHGQARAGLLVDLLLPKDSLCPKLLIVQPNEIETYTHTFEEHGFLTSTAVTLEEVNMRLSAQGLPDAALISGQNDDAPDAVQICRYLRRHSDTPTFILAHEGDRHKLPAALTRYADFTVDASLPAGELAATVRRKTEQFGLLPSEAKPIIEIDENLQVDLVHRTVHVSGKAITLAPLETRMLHIFIRQNGQTLTDTFIGERLGYDMKDPGTKVNLAVYISRLRNKLTPPDGRKLNYIESQYGSGYRFISPLIA